MASSSALCTLKERWQHEDSSVLQVRQDMHKEQRASGLHEGGTNEGPGEVRGGRQVKGEGGRWRGGTQRRPMKKVASKLDLEDTWRHSR